MREDKTYHLGQAYSHLALRGALISSNSHHQVEDSYEENTSTIRWEIRPWLNGSKYALFPHLAQQGAPLGTKGMKT